MKIVSYWKERNKNEKYMLIFLLLMLLLLALNFGSFKEGLKDGMKPYQQKHQIDK